MRNYPLRISVLYFFVAALWIFFSDWLVELFVPADYVGTVQTLKGFGFIIITAFLLYFITRYYYKLIRKNELEYRQLFKDNPHPMWVYDTSTLRFLTVNDAAVEKYKYSHEDFRQMTIGDIRPPEDEASVLMFVKRIEDKTYHDSGIWRHQDRNGRLFFVRVTSHSTNFGRFKGRVVLAIDVDEQIQGERKLRLSEAKLKGLINNSDDLIWMLDTAGVIVTANEAFRRKFKQFLGVDIELSGRIDISQLPDSGFTKNWHNYFKLAFLGKKLRVEESVRSEGRDEYYEIILNPIYNEQKEIINVGCFARDITQRKESENQIREQVIKLREVAWIQSHEVRKPLANIMGLLNLFKSSQNHTLEQSEELMHHMEASCHELDAVIKKVIEKSSTQNPS